MDLTKRVVVNPDTSCWEWLGYRDSDGYAVKPRHWEGSRLVHRLVYESLERSVPEGLELDHVCSVKHCINPDHLEPVTHQENMTRRMNRQGWWGYNRKRRVT